MSSLRFTVDVDLKNEHPATLQHVEARLRQLVLDYLRAERDVADARIRMERPLQSDLEPGCIECGRPRSTHGTVDDGVSIHAFQGPIVASSPS